MKTIEVYSKLIKPFLIPVLLGIGYFQEIIFDKDISNAILLGTFILYVLFHGRQVKTGINGFLSHIGPRPPRPPRS